MRTVLATFVLLLAALSVQAALIDGLIAYYPFDNNSAADASGNALNLTMQGGASFGTGIVGGALQLDPRSNSNYAYRNVSPADAVFNFGAGDFTIQFWAYYLGGLGSEQVALEQWTGGSGPGWTFTKLNNGQYRLHSDGSFVDTSGLVLTSGVWYHVVGRKSGGTGEIYVNNAGVGSGSLSAMTNNAGTYPLIVGRRNPADGRDFAMHGRLDEVAIWGRALSNAEIAQLYNEGSGTPLQAVPEPSTLVWLLLTTPIAAARRRG